MPYLTPSIYEQFPGETDAHAIVRLGRIIDGFNAREAEGKWSEGRERNRATCIRARDAALARSAYR